ncbi:TPA: S6 family peptidase [Escherichia coli]
MSNDIPFQTYRDFAENKGMFAPSNKNIPIYDKNVNIKIFLQSLCLILVVFLH